MAEFNLSYYKEIVKDMVANGDIKGSAKDIKEYTQKKYEYDTQSDFKGVRPTEEPIPPNADKVLKPIPGGTRTDWASFGNGEIKYNEGTTTSAGVNIEAYITLPQTGTQQPTAKMALIASSDGLGFKLIDLNTAATEFRNSVPRTDADYEYYKKKLAPYYSNKAALQNSLIQPITENDLGFNEAIKKAINTISLNNFAIASKYAEVLKDSPNATVPVLQGYGEFVDTRNQLPGTTKQSQRVGSLTTEMDANAEFDRTVQQYVGDPDLVDKVNKLRKKYWNDLHNEELRRISTTTTVTDPFGQNANTQGIGYAPLTEQDRIEMRLNLIVNGYSEKDKTTKEKTVISTGIRKTSQEDLIATGAVIGSAYGKLQVFASDYGIKLMPDELLTRVTRSLIPGGVTAGISPESINTGITAEQNSIKQAAKIHYKTLAPYIDQGLKVSDITSNFQRIKEDEFGLTPNSIGVFDNNVLNAINGDKISSVNDFILGVRSDPSWRKTPKANEMAAEFINTILKSWGKVG